MKSCSKLVASYLIMAFNGKVLDALGSLIEKYSEDRVVDIGCGEGYYIRSLKERFTDKYFLRIG